MFYLGDYPQGLIKTHFFSQLHCMGKIEKSTFMHQWPEIPTVLSFEKCWSNLLNYNTISVTELPNITLPAPSTVVVSEKLDGSNICICSNGIVASRRKIILKNPSMTELDNTKFCGVPLGNHIATCLEKVSNIAQYIRAKLYEICKTTEPFFRMDEMRHALDERIEVCVYGEWIHRNCQSADSKIDMYNYGQRGFTPGHLYAFGLSIILSEANNSTTSVKLDIDQILKWIICITDEDGKTSIEPFVIKKCADLRESAFLIFFFNGRLQKLLKEFQFETVPILSDNLVLDEAVRVYGHQLIPPNSKNEGIIVTSPNLSDVFKLKNPVAEGNDPLNIERYAKLEQYFSDNQEYSNAEWTKKTNSKTLNIIRQMAFYYKENVKLRKVNNCLDSNNFKCQLLQAYNSAVTKFPHFSDYLNEVYSPNMEQNEMQVLAQQEYEKYKNLLRYEMIRDLVNNRINNASVAMHLIQESQQDLVTRTLPKDKLEVLEQFLLAKIPKNRTVVH